MASVYRARELALGRDVALKQLTLDAAKSNRASLVAWFEHELHTLAQLNHPCVITVYDYGISERGPYYTMELLEGGDIRERVPVPWQEPCALFFDVCSSLALLHSRRLVHRSRDGGLVAPLPADRLSPLTAAQTRELLSSVFGDVANLDSLTRELHAIARGNPSATMDLRFDRCVSPGSCTRTTTCSAKNTRLSWTWMWSRAS